MENHQVASLDEFNVSQGPKSTVSNRNSQVFKPLSSHDVIDSYRKKLNVSKSLVSSQYAQGTMQTENLKFEQFLSVLLKSPMNPQDIKTDILHYVKVLETNYTDKITKLQMNLDRAHKQIIAERTKHVDRIIERSDLEALFTDSIEEVRRKIVHRRLTSELNSRSVSQKGRSQPGT